MARRRLRPEEQALWDKVAQSATPLKRASIPKPLEVTPASKRNLQAMKPATRIETFQVGSKAGISRDHDLMQTLPERLHGAPVAMDRKAFAKLKRGKLSPEGKIDLHGMTLAQAHPALLQFIMASQAAGRRLVLVITGKGKTKRDEGPIPMRPGALKHQVPDWLRAPAMAGAVLQVTPAHRRHGGDGAYYVYLRRRR
jgi:DNA-nicking Smr family endonuclease